MSRIIEKVTGVNCNEIAQINADVTDGFNSKALVEALKMVETAGLNTGEPLSELLLVSDREVDFGGNGTVISAEGDLVLTLRAKAGDSDAFIQLMDAHKKILASYAYKISTNAKMPYEDAESIVKVSYMECIMKTKIVSNGKICKSVSKANFDGIINKYLCNESASLLSANHNAKAALSAVKRAMEKNHLEIQDLTIDMVKDLLPAIYKTGKNQVSAKGIFSMLLSRNSVSYEEVTDEATDEGTKSNAIIGQLAVSSHENEVCDREEMKEFMETVTKLSEEVCVLIFTDYYSKPSGSVTYEDMAEKYGITHKEVKAALCSGKRKLLKTLKANNPEFYEREKSLRS